LEIEANSTYNNSKRIKTNQLQLKAKEPEKIFLFFYNDSKEDKKKRGFYPPLV
jgi:hypothetical protein